MGYIMGCACFKGKFFSLSRPLIVSLSLFSFSLFLLHTLLFHFVAARSVCVTASCFLPLIRHISSLQKATLQRAPLLPRSSLSRSLAFLLCTHFRILRQTRETSLNDVITTHTRTCALSQCRSQCCKQVRSLSLLAALC